jgi:DNA-binding PadR family transcriptional regulator
MEGSAVSFRYFALGLLAQQPLSGYDIKKRLEALDWLIGSPSFGSLYPALHALLERGLVTVAEVSGEGSPTRKIYRITEKGRQELRRWIDRPVGPGASLKAFVMRLILASNLSPAGLLAHLKQRRSQIAVQRAALEQTVAAQDEATDLGQRLARDYALAVALAESAWLDRTLEQLQSDRSVLAGVAERESIRQGV